MNTLLSNEQQPRQKFLRKWILIFIAWTIAGTVFTIQSYVYRLNVGQNVIWWSLYPREIFYFLLWGAFTPLVFWTARRFRVERKNWLPRTLLHIGIAIIVAVIQRILYDSIILTVNASSESPFAWSSVFQSVLGFADYGVFIYLIVLIVAQAIDYYLRYHQEMLRAAQLREALSSAQLQALRMQLQPHFLFNTLNTISVLIHEEPPAAARIVELLSDFLRTTLERATAQEVALRQEIEFLRLYLDIEQTRFGDRLSVNIQTDPETLDALVPPLILQPLVENAIKHGIAKHRGNGCLEIISVLSDITLCLTVKNSGTLSLNHTSHGEGIGLVNTRARLETLYGPAASATFTLSDDSATMEITIPYHI